MRAIRGGRVELSCVRPLDSGLDLEFVVKIGRAGGVAAKWRVSCSTVREWRISDATGGGIRVYPATHPAAKQYASVWTQLSFTPGERQLELAGAVAQAHVGAVGDWIPVDRYARPKRPTSRTVVWRGPDFLMRAYAHAIRQLGVPVRVARARRAGFGPCPCKVLHFGESYVVAGAFVASPEVARLPNKGMKLTKPG